MIDDTIMVVVVLAVVLLRVDSPALDILGMMQSGPLLLGDHAVRPGTVFHVGDMHLIPFQTPGFALCQATGAYALLDAGLVIGFALIDMRRGGLAQSQNRQGKTKGNDCPDISHGFLLGVGLIP
jgi:hypothetical protein